MYGLVPDAYIEALAFLGLLAVFGTLAGIIRMVRRP